MTACLTLLAAGRGMVDSRGMSRLLTDEEITRQLEVLPGWSRDGDTLRSTYEATSFVSGIEFVRRVAEDAEEMNHHPDIQIRWNKVALTLSTHTSGGITEKDFRLAEAIDRV